MNKLRYVLDKLLGRVYCVLCGTPVYFTYFDKRVDVAFSNEAIEFLTRTNPIIFEPGVAMGICKQHADEMIKDLKNRQCNSECNEQCCR